MVHSAEVSDLNIFLLDIFIQDRVDDGDVKLQWCASDDMVGDFFTKTLQGTKFEHFRRLIMDLLFKF